MVNLLLDRIRKRSANREKLAELSLNLLQELTFNYKKVQKRQQVETDAIRKMVSFVALEPNIGKLLIPLLDLFNSYNERLSAGKEVADLGLEKAMLDVYSQPSLHNKIRVGIINSPRFRHPTAGVCGHWGIAPPNFYRENLRNFSCHYISPADFKKILEYDVVINPYGEAWVLKDCEEGTIWESVETLKGFLRKGGIWVHTGGLPFHVACDPSGKKRVEVGGEVRRHLGLSFERLASADSESIELTKEAKLILGDVDLLPGASYRVCTNADRVWIKVAGKVLVGFKGIGDGGILFQGGLYYMLTVKELPYYMSRIVNLICLEGG